MLATHTTLSERGRFRNQSLTYGVSDADLERAARFVNISAFLLHAYMYTLCKLLFRTVLSDTNDVVPAPFSLQMPVRKEGRGKFNQARHSLPDLFQGLNNHKPTLLHLNTPDLSNTVGGVILCINDCLHN